jgi:arabinogalactan oligomer/maltooligosaccharide transport system permease protein
VNRPDEKTRLAVLAGLAGSDPDTRRRAFLALCLVPALLVLVLVLVYPLFYNVLLSFSDAGLQRVRDWRFAGFTQYLLVFREPEFWIVFGKTLVWTAASTILQVGLGVLLALVLHQHFLRGGSAWRILLLLPWAMPQYIAALTWRGMFHGDHGPVNSLLAGAFGLPPVDWLTTPAPAFVAAILVNVWMGFPFMMIVALAGLRAIPPSVYEAATLDGASTWQQFTRLTTPLLRPLMLPATTLAIIWNFNSLNVIWLFSNGGEPSDSTQILVSYVYKAAFHYYRFGWAAALSVVIFVILFAFVQTFLQFNRWRR